MSKTRASRSSAIVGSTPPVFDRTVLTNSSQKEENSPEDEPTEHRIGFSNGSVETRPSNLSKLQLPHNGQVLQVVSSRFSGIINGDTKLSELPQYRHRWTHPSRPQLASKK